MVVEIVDLLIKAGAKTDLKAKYMRQCDNRRSINNRTVDLLIKEEKDKQISEKKIFVISVLRYATQKYGEKLKIKIIT